MKKLLIMALLIGLTSLLLISCSGSSPNSAKIKVEGTIPSKIIGSPDRIHIVSNNQEILYQPSTDNYIKILEIIRKCFPDKLKEASLAIVWSNDSGLDWDMMSEHFDYLRLSYDTKQTVNLSLMNNEELPTDEISFYDIVFPLSSEHAGVVIIDTSSTSDFLGKTYGPLDMTSEIIAELLGYQG